MVGIVGKGRGLMASFQFKKLLRPRLLTGPCGEDVIKSLHPKLSKLVCKTGVSACMPWGMCTARMTRGWVLVRVLPLICCLVVSTFLSLSFLTCQVRMAACLTESADAVWNSVLREFRWVGRLAWKRRW